MNAAQIGIKMSVPKKGPSKPPRKGQAVARPSLAPAAAARLTRGTSDVGLKRRKSEAPTLCEHVKAIIAERNEKKETLHTPMFRRLSDAETNLPANGAAALTGALRLLGLERCVRVCRK